MDSAGNIRFLSVVLILGVLASPASLADQTGGLTHWSWAGHVKYQFNHTHVPVDSVFQDIDGDSLQDHNFEFRFQTSARRDHWDAGAHLQLVATHSDALSGLRDLPLPGLPGSGIVNDDRRWFNLTRELTNEGSQAAVLRLDRLSIGYTGDRLVARFGRQAVSWGNGLLYTPMDIFNPFDPTAVDKEYKSGDDMLYGQFLFANGNDAQMVGVVRRDPVSGDVEYQQSSLALKYHGLSGGSGYDLLLADHYGDTVLGVGGNSGLGGAVLHADVVWTDSEAGSVWSGVAGISYSWIAAQRNWTGMLEYYYNGFGQPGGRYTPDDLAGNPELLRRLERGELFTLGRHYLGVSLSMELTPLLVLGPNLFVNLTDPSALMQVVLTYDLREEIQLLAALGLPVGPSGSEYGGIGPTADDRYLSTGASLFAQLAWYF